jgi:thiamine-phosphate pyrophosphorylase
MNSIYAITPVNLSLEKIISKTSNLLELGIKTYQYRDKNNDLNIIKDNSKILLELIKENGGELIINDYPEIALEIGADGFHLGFEDYQKKKNQNFLKKHLNLIKENYIKGLSCKWNLELVSNPPEDILEWDYLAVGSFFKSQTKKDISLARSDMIMKEVLLKTKKPLYSIGGINNENIINLKKMGYKKFAISKGVYAFEDHEIKNIIKINNEGN